MKLKWYHIVAFLVVLLLISFVVRIRSGEYERQAIQSYKKQRLVSLASIAEAAILDKLKAPSTAEFPDYLEYDYRVSKEEDNVYFVIGYVDAENSYGAKLRSDFIVKCKYINPENYKVLEADVE